MRSIPTIVRHPAVLLAAASILVATMAARAYAPFGGPLAAAPTCTAPVELTRFEHPLPRLAQRLAAGAPVTIVAIGSSSTYGEGASAPAATYPSRLAAELAQRFPQSRITVLNRGENGDTDNDMRARFATDVIAERPDVVIWQLGTNSMLDGEPMHLPVLRADVQRLQAATGADVMLLDPQYAPAVVESGQAGTVLDMIAQTASGTGVNLFRRFEMMRRWHEVEGIGYTSFLSEDTFHMNDWSYGCLARAMGAAMAEAATRPAQVAL